MSQQHGRFEDALFHQTQHLRFCESDRGKRYLDTFQRSVVEKDPNRGGVFGIPGALRVVVTETLRRADPVYVSPDVTTMIEAAVPKFEPEPILPSDPFVPMGFAYFPRSLKHHDRKGKLNGVRALAWCPVARDGAVLAENDPRFVGVFMQWFSHETDTDGEGEEPQDWRALHPLAELQLLNASFVPFDEPWDKMEISDPDGITYPDAIRQQWVLPQVMWRLGQQVVPAKERPQRQFRREANRHGLIQDEVSVLRLRRSYVRYEGEGEGEIEYDHRWLVRGHWRKQWYPSMKTHRQVWINPYVKGPEDKPLILTDRAVEFVR